MSSMSSVLKKHSTLSLAVLALASMGHVGSPDTYFSGQAGPYPIRVIVRLPGVIPGRAQIAVRVPGTSAGTLTRVQIRAALWTVGIEGAPPAEIAQPVAGDPELYAAEVWFMAPSSYRLFVTVDGPNGTGTAIVPTVALATAQREMTRGLGVLLLGLAAFLSVGMITIVGCAVRESGLPPGVAPDERRFRRARAAMTVTGVVIAAALWGGHRWWAAEAFSYGRFVLYRPFAVDASVAESSGRASLTLRIRDERWPARRDQATRWNDLLPDHGKLMHLFLIREAALDAFAHLHPVADGPSAQAFTAPLPALPAGRYRVFGDIVHESGYAQTLVASVNVTGGPSTSPDSGDPDDSWYHGSADSGSIGRLPGVGEIEWVRGRREAILAGAEETLTFAARGTDGRPLGLEPYMGMLAHVVVVHEDGSVFTHLHPGGTISMGALDRFVARDGGTTAHHPDHAIPPSASVAIPYAFPKPGAYVIWVQMKHAGVVRTVAYRTDVQPTRP